MNSWDIRDVLHWSYWLTQPLTAQGRVAVMLWIVMAALVVAGLIGFFLYSYGQRKALRKVWYELALGGISGGLYGLLWMGLRQERIPLWSLRLWLVPLWAFLIWRAYRAYRFYSKRLPQIKAEQTQKARREQYLPKPHRS